MPVPKKRLPSSRRDRRRSHHALKATGTVECPSCGADTLPHHACPACGTYKGRSVAEGQASKDAKKAEKKAFLKRAEEGAGEHDHDHEDHDHEKESKKDAKEEKKEDKK